MQKAIHAVFLAVVMLSIFLSGCAPAPAPVLPTLTPIPTVTPVLTASEEFTTAAWNTYLEKEYSLAIELAQETIDRWEEEAIEQQAVIEKAPPVGTVTNAKKKKSFLMSP
jgi:hypothetical protein